MPNDEKNGPSPSTPVSSTKHSDRRATIPTPELGNFMPDDEWVAIPVRYPRDPYLDPQLVWNGKDEQDSQDLVVPAVPIYIHEKVHPQDLISQLVAETKADTLYQPSLFSDFNGIHFEELVDFYSHEQRQKWANRMILGDSLLVMTSLAEKEQLKGKVQMIYVDPPYGIKFGSNWQVSTRKRNIKDGRPEDITHEPEQVRAFRDTWEKGIHSYLSYWRDRLRVSQDLLSETGSIFVQIGDANIHLVRCLLDEVFGSENFRSLIFVAKTSGFADAASLGSVGDYIIWYAKNASACKYHQLYMERTDDSTFAKEYRFAECAGGRARRSLTRQEVENPQNIPAGWRRYRLSATTSQGATVGGSFELAFEDSTFRPLGDQHWKTSPDGMRNLMYANRLVRRDKSLSYVRYLEDFPMLPYTNNWTDVQWGFGAGDKQYVVETNPSIIARCLLMTTDPGDLVLDPTCGSGTTAYVAEQWGRRWITIDTSRVALALARTRIMSARYPYYLLADSPEGIRKEEELTGNIASSPNTEGNIKNGFVYRRVPHVTLRAIANNADLSTITTRWQSQLDALRTRLNSLLEQSWEEWQVPSYAETTWPQEAQGLHEEWWHIRMERQREIDEAISRHSETEILYDKPYEDHKRVRVAGPFTIESLSPHRVLSTDADQPMAITQSREQPTAVDFVTSILENLKKAGVQNTRKGERLYFDFLERNGQGTLQATGEYTEKDGTVRRVAVCIGPEYGTVGPDLVRTAAKKAMRGLGFDLLLVCGFAFDAYVPEEVKQYGKLTVLPVKISTDLMVGEEHLKKTDAANLFMVFGEPDLKVLHQPDRKLVVEVLGLDVYDPTTGETRSNSTNELACWFIDTNYNEESFVVRHAYFTGAGDPLDKLKRALKAEIDHNAWASIYATKSRPFDPPITGKIAVKVINHYGDEALKVYSVGAQA
jgi:adenine-specific DNA-methyltransferase